MINEYDKYILLGIAKYFLAILIFSIGYVIGGYVTLLWYAWGVVLLIRKDFEGIMGLYLMFIFLSSGAYHYGMRGDVQWDFLTSNYDKFLVLLLLFLVLLKHSRRDISLEVLMKYGKWLAGYTAIGAILNFVSLIDIADYFIVSFRWLIIIILAAYYDMDKEKSANLVGLFFAIVMVNSVFGFLQTVLFSVQTTPDGYTPNILDVASGFLGVTFSQVLTTLCLVVFYFFFYRFIVLREKKAIPYMVIVLLQPFFSSSKASLFFMTLILLFSLTQMNSYMKVNVISAKMIFRLAIVVFFFWMGFSFYNSINERYVTSDVQLARFFDRKQAITDFAKVQGYIESFTIVAPMGNAGLLIGVGPTNFTSSVGFKKKVGIIRKLGLDVERNKVSSADFRATDITGIIGELGIIGFLLYVFFFISLYVFWLRRVRLHVSKEQKIFSFFIAQWIISVLIFSFYSDGWFLNFFYFPLVIMMIYDLKFNK